MTPLLIFGLGKFAEVAHFYFTHDSDYQVVGFVVDAAHRDRRTWYDVPVVTTEEAPARFAPADHAWFAAVGYSRLNDLRTEKMVLGEALGYRLASYVSSRAKTWPGFVPGPHAFILEDNTLQPFTRIGANVVMWSGNHLGHHAELGDNVFLSSHVVVSGSVTIDANSFIGVNATIADGVRIGARCIVGAGALVLKDLDDGAVVAAEASPLRRLPSHRVRI